MGLGENLSGFSKSPPPPLPPSQCNPIKAQPTTQNNVNLSSKLEILNDFLLSPEKDPANDSL